MTGASRDDRGPAPAAIIAPAVLVALIAVWVAIGSGTRAAHRAEIRSMRVDLNLAGVDRLRLLPGIGPAMARRIIADREARGRYASLGDVARVPGVGPRTLAEIEPFAAAGAP